jgi:hypothetical protein
MTLKMEEFLAEAGLKKLSKTWAKLEIVVGLLAAATGLLAGQWALVATGTPDWVWVAGGVLLFSLGGYLALAGNRSHLYQSNNYLAAMLLEAVRKSKG